MENPKKPLTPGKILNIAALAKKTLKGDKSVGNYQQRISQAFKGSIHALNSDEIEVLVHRIEYEVKLSVKHLRELNNKRIKSELADQAENAA